MQRLRTALGLGAAIACAVAAPASADWPIYGHDLANSRNAGAEGPAASQVATLKQAWSFTTSDGDFTGTPVVADGVVVAGTNGGSIFALDAVTGKVRWSRDINQQINGTAAIDKGAGLVFVPVARSDTPHLLALSLRDGSVVWDHVLTHQTTSSVFGSPVFWHGVVYMGTSAAAGDVSTARGTVVALDERTGAVRWQTFIVPHGFDGGSVWSTPAIDAATGRLYVGTGNAYHDPVANTTDAIVAIDALTGRMLGHFQATSGDAFDEQDSPLGPDSDFGASPNLLVGPGGQKLVGEGQKSGTYWALDRATLKPVWDTKVGVATGPVGAIVGSTAFDAARVYGPSSAGGEIWSLDHAGALQWASADGGPVNFSPVALANGVLWTVDFSSVLTARDPATGLVLAKLPLGAPTFGGVSISGSAVYAAVGTQNNSSGQIIAFGDTSPSAVAPASSGVPAG